MGFKWNLFFSPPNTKHLRFNSDGKAACLSRGNLLQMSSAGFLHSVVPTHPSFGRTDVSCFPYLFVYSYAVLRNSKSVSMWIKLVSDHQFISFSWTLRQTRAKSAQQALQPGEEVLASFMSQNRSDSVLFTVDEPQWKDLGSVCYLLLPTSRVCGPHLSLLWYKTPSSFALEPGALSCALSAPLWSCSPSVFRAPFPVDLRSTALATFSRKAFLSDSIPSWRARMWGRVCDRDVWVILFERAVKAGVTAAPVLCWPPNFSDFSPLQLSRMKRWQAVVHVSITCLDI